MCLKSNTGAGLIGVKSGTRKSGQILTLRWNLQILPTVKFLESSVYPKLHDIEGILKLWPMAIDFIRYFGHPEICHNFLVFFLEPITPPISQLRQAIRTHFLFYESPQRPLG